MSYCKWSLVCLCALALVSAAARLDAKTKIIKIDGSSTVFPITEAVAEEFQKQQKGAVHVTVGVSGTGGGFKSFCRGETDISNASRPIAKKEMDACRERGITYIELPVAFDALTVVIHPKNTWARSMTIKELHTIWNAAAKGKITRWNQVNASWPDKPLKLYGPGADSGTFDYFKEAVLGQDGIRSDFESSEDDNVLVQGVASNENALGYFGYAYYVENQYVDPTAQNKVEKIRAVSIDGGKGPVAPSIETVENGVYFPLSRPIFIYVSKKSAREPHVRQFVEFYLKNAPTLVKEVQYIPLQKKDYELALERFRQGKTGTVFGGKSIIGMRISELFKLKLKS